MSPPRRRVEAGITLIHRGQFHATNGAAAWLGGLYPRMHRTLVIEDFARGLGRLDGTCPVGCRLCAANHVAGMAIASVSRMTLKLFSF